MAHTRMTRRTFAQGTAAAVAAGSAAAAIGISASRAAMAQGATPVAEEGPGLPPPPEGATVVAEGLLNPRFLAFGDDGTLYITETGVGGDEVIGQPEVGTSEIEGGTPVASPVASPVAEEPAAPPSTRGYTGRISQLTADGTQSVLVEGLVSYSDGAGPNGIALGPNEIYFTIGGIAVGFGLPDALPGENTVNRFVLGSAAPELIASLGDFEVANNPDGTDVNPNLYGMASTADGRLLVADAGGNTLYTVNPADNTFELSYTLPTLGEYEGEFDATGQEDRQVVPTGVTLGPDGVNYVGFLGEFWPQGAPAILELGADGAYTGIAPSAPIGFNVAITVGPDGLLYASSLFTFVEGSEEPGPGSVVRILEDGTVEPVLPAVFMPHGIAFDAAGNMYVATNSLMSGPGFPAGQVIRVDGVASA